MAHASPGAGGSAGTAHLRRDVGFWALTFVSLGSVIGSGWLLGALNAASVAGGASVLSWVISGVIVVFLALVHAELGSTYPISGGTARYPRLAFGSFTGFSAGWAAWLQSVTLAPIEVEASLSYLDHKWHGLVNGNGALTGMGLAVAGALMLIFTVINILGVRWLAETNSVAVVWKTAVPVLTIAMLLIVSFKGSNFTAGGGFAPYGAHGVFAAMPLGVAFALQGFEQAVQLGSEARNPQRDLPRAVLGAMIVGTLIYIGLEIAFIGALDPANLLHGWANPIGKGDFGPYATLASALGLGWLAVVLYIDAFVSPAGTGLVYVGTSSRLAYALGHAGYVPRGVGRLSARGVPITSIIISFVVGFICLLPFPSWKSLVSLVTSATFIMYAFAPVTLAALRRTDPDRPRPYRLPWAVVLAPLSFILANEMIYWAGWITIYKLMLAMVLGYLIFALSYLFGRRMERPPLDLRTLGWLLPWLGGTALISYLGQYEGIKVIPSWIDLAVVAVFNLIIFYVANALALPAERAQEAIARDLTDTDLDEVVTAA